VATAELIRAHRSDLELLTGLATRDLDLIWAEFTTAELARDGLMDVLPELANVYGSAAATLGADWYDETRTVAAVPGRFGAILAPIPDRTWADILARWAVGPLFAKEPDWSAAKSLVDGGLEKAIADVDRETITTTAVKDPQAIGWKRVGSGACDFCKMIIGRNVLYRSNHHFASHNNCHCQVVPAWGGQPEPVNPYTPTTRNVSPAAKARVRGWLKANPQI
jgi:hypothetical protein